MKYRKGTFVVVPNKEQLKGKPSELQSVFFWICQHADDEGECFPSRKLLATESGTGLRRIDKYLTQLIELGLITKKIRPRIGTKSKLSNLYQIQIIDEVVAKEPEPSSQSGVLGSSQKEAVTVSSINSTHLTTNVSKADTPSLKKTKKQLREEAPFDDKKEQQALWDSGWLRKKIVHNYFEKKNIHFENVKQFDSAVGRYLKVAEKLEGYTWRQIEKTMDYFEEKKLSWTLETIAKNISEVVNRK